MFAGNNCTSATSALWDQVSQALVPSRSHPTGCPLQLLHFWQARATTTVLSTPYEASTWATKPPDCRFRSAGNVSSGTPSDRICLSWLDRTDDNIHPDWLSDPVRSPHFHFQLRNSQVLVQIFRITLQIMLLFILLKFIALPPSSRQDVFLPDIFILCHTNNASHLGVTSKFQKNY